MNDIGQKARVEDTFEKMRFETLLKKKQVHNVKMD